MAGRHRLPGRFVTIVDGVGYVPLGRGYVVAIDLGDIPFVGRWRWRAHVMEHTTYASRRRLKSDGEGPAEIFLHRELMSAPAGRLVDHRDGDGLNCRRGNMRVCTEAQNLKNRRRRKSTRMGLPVGVSPSRSGKRFRAAIVSDGVVHRLGAFATPAEAHAAYLAAADRLHGEFASAA